VGCGPALCARRYCSEGQDAVAVGGGVPRQGTIRSGHAARQVFRAGVRGADLPPLLTPHVSYRSYGSAKLYAEVAVATEGREGDGTGDERSGQRSGRLAKPEHCLTTVDLAEPPRLKTLRAYDTHDGFRAGSWAPALWPQHPEPLFAVAALAACMIDGNDYERPGNVPLADGLKLILEPDVPIGPMALFMLCRSARRESRHKLCSTLHRRNRRRIAAQLPPMPCAAGWPGAERWATLTKQPTKTRVHFRP
jgi:hypothetical protein